MAQQINVIDFGARDDGSFDNTEAFQSALAAARDAGGGTVHVPAGEFRIRLSDARTFTGLHVPANCELLGAGVDQTIIRAIGSSAKPEWSSIRMIMVDPDTRVAGLTIDGDRDAIPRAQFKDKAAILLRTVPDARGVIFEDLHARNGFCDGEAEGFGVSITRSTDSIMRNIEAYDNDGSGLTTGSADLYEKRSDNITIDNVRCYRNGWQGVTMYGARNVIVTNAQAFENVRHGLNVEWSDDVVIRDSRAWNNGIRGLRVAGLSSRVRWENVTSENNGADNANGAELFIGMQAYAAVNPASGRTEIGFPQDVEVVNCELNPSKDRPHVLCYLQVEKISVGLSSPQRLVFDGNGVERWTFKTGGKPGRQIPGIQFPNLGRGHAQSIDVGAARLDKSARTAPADNGRSRQAPPTPEQELSHESTTEGDDAEEPGILNKIAHALGLDAPTSTSPPEAPEVNQRRQLSGAPALDTQPQPPAQADSGAIPDPTGGTTVTISNHGGFVEYPVPDGGRQLCRLRYQINEPATWRFELRSSTSNEVVQEIRHIAKPNGNDARVWFDSAMLTPPGSDGPYVLRIVSADQGEHSLTLGSIEFAAL